MTDRNTAPRLRDGRIDDLPALLALEALFPGDRLSPRQFRRHLRSPTARLRVAELDAAVAGYALVFRRSGSRVARLYSIVVAPIARGRGLGAALLADLETVARAGGADAVHLEVRFDNAAAIALYRAHGYVQTGRIDGYYEDGTDALRFARCLDADGPRTAATQSSA